MIKEKAKRLQFDFTTEFVERVERLKLATGSTTMVQLVRMALSLLKKVLDLYGDGGELIFRDKDGKETSVVLIL